LIARCGESNNPVEHPGITQVLYTKMLGTRLLSKSEKEADHDRQNGSKAPIRL
jgi:hypothetical protein